MIAGISKIIVGSLNSEVSGASTTYLNNVRHDYQKRETPETEDNKIIMNYISSQYTPVNNGKKQEYASLMASYYSHSREKTSSATPNHTIDQLQTYYATCKKKLEQYELLREQAKEIYKKNCSGKLEIIFSKISDKEKQKTHIKNMEALSKVIEFLDNEANAQKGIKVRRIIRNICNEYVATFFNLPIYKIEKAYNISKYILEKEENMLAEKGNMFTAELRRNFIEKAVKDACDALHDKKMNHATHFIIDNYTRVDLL